MALKDSATLVVGVGSTFYTAPQGTARPDDDAVRSPASPWVEIGHTSNSDIFAWNSEGGEETVLGTLQNGRLRVTRSSVVESFTVKLQQWDEDALKLYFGSNAVKDGSWTQLPEDPAPTRAAFLAVFKDGAHTFAVHCPLVELFRGDAPEIADTESLASLPVKVTPLRKEGNNFSIECALIGG